VREVICNCGGLLRPCGIGKANRVQMVSTDQCCLLGWVHVETGRHGCTGLGAFGFPVNEQDDIDLMAGAL
jgi:hypothetical protein